MELFYHKNWLQKFLGKKKKKKKKEKEKYNWK